MESLNQWCDASTLSSVPIWFVYAPEFIFMRMMVLRSTTGLKVFIGRDCPAERVSMSLKFGEVSANRTKT